MTPYMAPIPNGNGQDPSPMVWCAVPIRSALRECEGRLEQWAKAPTEADEILRAARVYVHQVDGAFRMLGFEALAKVSGLAEAAIETLVSLDQSDRDARVAAILSLTSALSAHVEKMAAGGAVDALPLFPYFHALASQVGRKSWPAELYEPPQWVEAGLATDSPVDLEPGARTVFEKGLLSWMRGDHSAATSMAQALAPLVFGQPTNSLWTIAAAVLKAMSVAALPPDLDMRTVLARISALLRGVNMDAAARELLVRELLFSLAHADPPPAEVQAVVDLYGLRPVDRSHYTGQRYVRVDSAKAVHAKEALNQAKLGWDAVVRGAWSDLGSFAAESARLAHALAALDETDLARLIMSVARAAKGLSTSQMPPSDGMNVDVACALLATESALDTVHARPADFKDQIALLAQRIERPHQSEVGPRPLPDWLESLVKQAHQRLTMAAFVAECHQNLRHVESILDEYFKEPSRRDALPQALALLDQLAGALSLLGRQDAVSAVTAGRQSVEAFIASNATPDPAAFERIASNFGALGFFLSALAEKDSPLADAFRFDPEAGLLLADLVPHAASAALIDPLAEDLPAPEPHQEADLQLTSLLTHEFDLGFPQEMEAANDGGAPSPAGDSGLPATEPESETLFADLDDAALDAELMKVFFDEAHGYLVAANGLVEVLRGAPDDLSQFVALRRLFHTLKGSSRVVGFEHLAAASSALEELMHRWFAEARWVEAEFLGFLVQALEQLRQRLGQLRDDPSADPPMSTLLQEAQAWLTGSAEADASGPGPQDSIDALLAPSQEVAAISGVPTLNEIIEQPMQKVGFIDHTDPFEEAPGLVDHGVNDDAWLAEGLEAPELEAALEVPVERAPAEPVLTEMTPAEIAPAERGGHAARTSVEVGSLQLAPELFDGFLKSADQHIRVLVDDIVDWREQPKRLATDHAVHASLSLANDAQAIGLHPVSHLAHAYGRVLEAVREQTIVLPAPAQMLVFEAVALLQTQLHQFAGGAWPQSADELVEEMNALVDGLSHPETLQLPNTDLFDTETTVEDIPAVDLVEAEPTVTFSELQDEPQVDELPDLDFSWDEPAEPAAPVEPEPTLTPEIEPVREEDLLSMADLLSISQDLSLNVPVDEDTPDRELLPVFIDEGDELLPEIGQCLRRWRQAPSRMDQTPALMRLLHTAKGSARMAGCMGLGAKLHAMEARVEGILMDGHATVEAVDELLQCYDQVVAAFDHLAGRGLLDGPAEPEKLALNAPAEPDVGSAPEPDPLAGTGSALEGANVNTPVVRVRADVLDRMVSQSGEVSVARARLEDQLDSIRGSVNDLTENVARMRMQLRELEIQSESSMQSRIAESDRNALDPLEFDRYTRFQELTRMLAESVEDVATAQQNLIASSTEASRDLGRQSQATRDLHQELMRVRMVQFGPFADRFFRVVRQTAQHLGKKASLELIGAGVEVDRGILERMAAPIEHLLRNAVVHGLEFPDEREACGKNIVGKVSLEVRQDGNEVVVVLSDDGRGLDAAKLKERAIERGLITPNHVLSDQAAFELIFAPGFTTADQVTELAGRGVGMDVVRSEAAALGGRVEVESTLGHGARFTIHLPLSLVVAQVVLVRVGAATYAIPSVLVQQMLQVKSAVLEEAYQRGQLQTHGVIAPLAYLGTLLEDMMASPPLDRQCPVLLVTAGNETLAVHVDALMPSKEVVVKSVGPQLARIAGITGATVLGNGQIVLILNPVQLSIRQRARAGHALTLSALPVRARAVVHAPMVMVVDDSLTVRRVTQRLLSRAGYEVVLAKDGVDALRLMEERRPDLMLVDIEMPRMDGFDLVRHVRADAATQTLPVIMITSRTGEKHRNIAKGLGVNEYLGKPYNDDELLGLISRYLQQV